MSVWVNLLVEPTYGDTGDDHFRDFLGNGATRRQRWQDDVKERFIRSALQVRHASKYAGEYTYEDANPRQVLHNSMSWNWSEDRLLFLNTGTRMSTLGKCCYRWRIHLYHHRQSLAYLAFTLHSAAEVHPFGSQYSVGEVASFVFVYLFLALYIGEPREKVLWKD